MFIIRNWYYFVTFLACIAGYFITGSLVKQKLIEKEIIYNCDSSSEVYIVWGIIESKVLRNYWPPDSYEKNGMVYSKLLNKKNSYYTAIKLPVGSDIYYWMVKTMDNKGNKTEVWDGGNKAYYFLHYNDPGLFKPGYFIFLSGFIPLIILFVRNRAKPLNKIYDQHFHIKSYINQFDSIRAIAVLFVIIHHWFAENKLLNFLPNGALGVNIFFVLSGFLITRILLKAKIKIDEKTVSESKAFRNFYIRRMLRIFPIYYLLLIIFYLVREQNIREDGIYYWTYTSNILFYNQQLWPANLSHLWSLAVEEQFYIIWPFLMILVNKRNLPYVICLFIIIGISSNYIFTEKGWWVMIFTPACFDAFAIGGFLSWLTIYRQGIILRIQPRFKWISAGIIVLFFLSVFQYSFFPMRTIHSLVAVSIIYYCLFKNNIGFVNLILNNKWLMQLGKVSYGVYLYHLFVPELWLHIINMFSLWNFDLFWNSSVPPFIKPVWLFIQEFSFLIFICILSWKLIEKPVNKLKIHFAGE